MAIRTASCGPRTAACSRPRRRSRISRRRCFHDLVIASAAKQSRLSPRRDSGLLRFARNDGGDVLRKIGIGGS
ncbi:hypothetical protein FXV83_26645, partial [Bradyrhizobium hipponense]